MSVFFTGWALWEKMTFVLALCIVVAMTLGSCRNIYNQWKLRQYTTVNLKQLTPEMIEAQNVDDGEIPFGIRALESGVEVEGVWISRSNTPVPSSCQDSPTASARASVASSILNEPSSFNLPESLSSQSVRSQRTSSTKPTWTTRKEPPSILERDLLTERQVSKSSNSKTQYASSNRSRRTSLPGSSGLRASMTMDSTPDHSSYDRNPTRGFSSGEEPDNEQPSFEPNTSLNFSSSSSTRSYHLALQQPQLETNSENRRRPLSWAGNCKGKGRLLEAGADLGLLQSHRMSHVAETGQLGPRIRRAENQSGEWAGADILQPPAPEPQSGRELASQSDSTRPKTSDGVTQRLFRSSNQSSSKMMITYPISTTRTLDADLDHHFIHLHAAPSVLVPVPRGLFETPMPAYLDNTSDTSSELGFGVVQHVERAKLVEESCSRPQPFTVDILNRPTHPERSFQADRSSKVLRKINSSFQVLKPGTLVSAAPAMEGLPPVNQNSPGHACRHSRKLHKEQA